MNSRYVEREALAERIDHFTAFKMAHDAVIALAADLEDYAERYADKALTREVWLPTVECPHPECECVGATMKPVVPDTTIYAVADAFNLQGVSDSIPFAAAIATGFAALALPAEEGTCPVDDTAWLLAEISMGYELGGDAEHAEAFREAAELFAEAR